MVSLGFGISNDDVHAGRLVTLVMKALTEREAKELIIGCRSGTPQGGIFEPGSDQDLFFNELVALGWMKLVDEFIGDEEFFVPTTTDRGIMALRIHQALSLSPLS